MLKRLLGLILTLAILFVVVNDVWRYATAQRALRYATYDIATWAAENAEGMPREKAAQEAVRLAEPEGVTIIGYDQDSEVARIWAQKEVSGTIVASIVANMLEGKKFEEARKAPFYISTYREAGIR